MAATGPAPHLAIIGLGATGCALLPLVATLPFATISLADGDTIETASLPRQPLYGPGDIGRFKVEVALERTAHLNVNRTMRRFPEFIDAGNISELLKDVDMVADCTDDLHARSLIDGYCANRRIPLVTAPIHEHQLQVLTLHATGKERQPLSLRSFFPQGIGPGQDGCEMRNVPVHVPAVAAALMCRAFAALLSGDGSHARHMDVIDLRNGSWIKIAAPMPPHQEDLIA